MKYKLLLLLLVAALILSACGTAAPVSTPEPAPEPTATPAVTPEPAPEPTPEPTPVPEPDTEPGTVRADSFGAVAAILSRGEVLSITGEEGDYYTVDLNGETAWVEKRLVRPAEEEPPEEKEMYATTAPLDLYDNPYFEGDPIATAGLNEKLKVLDIYGDLAVVEKDDVICVMHAGSLQDWPRVYQGGGNGGGDSSGGQDGGDIQLGARGGISGRWLFLANGSTGTVVADGTELYCSLLSSGDSVKVLEKDEEVCTLYFGLEKVTGTVPRWLIALEGDDSYEAWNGYAKYNAFLYPDHRMIKEGESLAVNTVVTVLWDVGNGTYLATVDGETLGYISSDYVSSSMIQNSGGSGGSSGQEWTDPVL